MITDLHIYDPRIIPPYTDKQGAENFAAFLGKVLEGPDVGIMKKGEGGGINFIVNPAEDKSKGSSLYGAVYLFWVSGPNGSFIGDLIDVAKLTKVAPIIVRKIAEKYHPEWVDVPTAIALVIERSPLAKFATSA